LLAAGCGPDPVPSAAGIAPLSGREIYLSRCASCHQADGSGVPGLCAPFASSPRLSGPPEKLIRIMLLGMKGSQTRDGVTYRGVMPSWRFDLTDEQIASVLNDIRSRWSPSAPPIPPDLVTGIRAETLGDRLFPPPEG